MGFVVLLLTLYATQYSGNTILGFSGKTLPQRLLVAGRRAFMTAIVVTYLILAEALHAGEKAYLHRR